MSIRPVKQIIKPQPTIEGAGVKLQRAFGFGNTDEFDPFLLLDDFRNDRPEDYRAGFPWRSRQRPSWRLQFGTAPEPATPTPDAPPSGYDPGIGH